MLVISPIYSSNEHKMFPNVPYHEMAENLEFVKESFKFSNDAVNIIKDSFGPNGLDSLISTSSGTLLLTNDGFVVLKSLSSANFVGKLMIQGLEKFYNWSGDFSKKFLLFTRELLGEVLDVVSVDETRSSEQILRISQGMNDLMFSLPQIFGKLQELGIISEGQYDEEQGVISILKTSVSGKFSPKTCNILVELVRQIIFDDETSFDIPHLKQTTERLLDSFSDVVWEAPGKPLTSSVILPGILIPQEFLTMIKKLPSSNKSNSFKFVIFGSSLGCDLPQSATVLSLKSSERVSSMLHWRQHQFENIIKMVANHGVQLILTSTTFHETFIHVCNQYCLAAIHLIPQEDIRRISEVFGVSPVFEIDDDFTSSIGVATSCKSIQVGLHLFVHLEPTKTVAKQMLLYAPTEALCRQYSIALQKMLKILRSSFTKLPDNSYVVSHVPAGGTFELALAYALEECKKLNTRTNEDLKLTFQVLEKACLSVPRQLLQNSSCKLSIFDMKARTRQALVNGSEILGVSQDGALGSLKDEGLIEPTMTNYLLVSSVLQLCVQILRTDRVIHVKSLPRASHNLDDSDSDN